MKNAWLSFLLIGVIACGSFGLSQAQTPADEVTVVPLQKQEEPPPQMRRDLSKIFASEQKGLVRLLQPLTPRSGILQMF